MVFFVLLILLSFGIFKLKLSKGFIVEWLWNISVVLLKVIKMLGIGVVIMSIFLLLIK